MKMSEFTDRNVPSPLLIIIYIITPQLTSGVAATRFSNGNVSLGTPKVNFEYGIPLGFSASSANVRRVVVNEDDDDGVMIRCLTN